MEKEYGGNFTIVWMRDGPAFPAGILFGIPRVKPTTVGDPFEPSTGV